ncbi:MAG: radical SAM protein [Anaerolineae bacterium]|nr:radical SAM protein [Anaerolineae bacterium]
MIKKSIKREVEISKKRELMSHFSTWPVVWHDLFVIPLVDQFLIYAPLHGMAALVNRAAVSSLKRAILSGKPANDARLDEIIHVLQTEVVTPPSPKCGNLAPAFLGLLPTRGCNLACRYCSFLATDNDNLVMSLSLAREAVDWYMDLVSQTDQAWAEIHYFGGEPFCAEEVIDFTVTLAGLRAHAAGRAVRFEVATNGAMDEKRCRWVADHFDTVVLSLDGPAEIQNFYRPYKNGRCSFEAVSRSARILSEGAACLFFRSCITDQTVDRMAEIATWFCHEYRPGGVCFEPLQPVNDSTVEQLVPPDPYKFARHFIQAAEILEAHGVESIYASADIRTRRVSFCPVGQDAVIVSPDGALNACYLLPKDWEAKGLDLCLGRMTGYGSIELDMERVARVRSLNVWNKPFCARCFCKWHCAGSCHVNHILPDHTGAYDRLCLQTRIIALRNILKSIGRIDLISQLLEDADALEQAAMQTSDILIDVKE